MSQVFENVSYEGLFPKIKRVLAYPYYLHLHIFVDNQNDLPTSLFPINTGLPQDNVLWPILYLLYTAAIATFADNAAILAFHADSLIASRHLLHNLDLIRQGDKINLFYIQTALRNMSLWSSRC